MNTTLERIQESCVELEDLFNLDLDLSKISTSDIYHPIAGSSRSGAGCQCSGSMSFTCPTCPGNSACPAC